MLTRSPHLLAVNLLKLALEVCAVSFATVEFERLSCLGTITDGGVELLEDWLVGFFEDGCPVKCTPAGGCGTGSVHVVHAGWFGINKDGQRTSVDKNTYPYFPIKGKRD